MDFTIYSSDIGPFIPTSLLVNSRPLDAVFLSTDETEKSDDEQKIKVIIILMVRRKQVSSLIPEYQ